MAIQVPLSRIEPNPWQTRSSYDEEHIKKIALSVLRHGLQQLPQGRVVLMLGGEPAVQTLDRDTLTDQETIDTLFERAEDASVQLAFGHNRRRALWTIAEWLDEGVRPTRPEEEAEEATRGEAGGEHVPIEESDLPEDVEPGCLLMRLQQYSDEEMADLAWTENEDREELTPLEEAKAIRQRMEDFGLSQTEVAKRLGMGRSTVSNKLRLLQLPSGVVDKVEKEGLSERAASALVPYYQLGEEQREAVRTREYGLRSVLEDIEDDPQDVTSSRVRDAVSGGLSRTPSIDEESFGADRNFVSDPSLDLEMEDVDEGRIEYPTCEGCPLAYEHDGALRCPKRSCLQEKREAWRTKVTTHVAGQLGVSVAEDLGHREYHGFDDDSRYGGHEHDAEAVAHALETGCDNLKLYPDGRHARHMTPTATLTPLRDEEEDVPARWVCEHGENGRCACLDRFKEEAQQEQSREKERIERLKAHVAEQLEPLFEDVPASVIGTVNPSAVDDAMQKAEDEGATHSDVVASVVESFVDYVQWHMGWDEKEEFQSWVRYFEEVLERVGIDHVQVRDPEAPPTAEQLRQLYEQATNMQDPDRGRCLKEARSDIGRRQDYLQTYDAGDSDGAAAELEALSELHGDVEEALSAEEGEAGGAAASTWNDEPPPDPAGRVKTRYRSPSNDGWWEETIHIYTVFGAGTTRKYYHPETEERGPLSELENRQWKY